MSTDHAIISMRLSPTALHKAAAISPSLRALGKDGITAWLRDAMPSAELVDHDLLDVVDRNAYVFKLPVTHLAERGGRLCLFAVRDRDAPSELVAVTVKSLAAVLRTACTDQTVIAFKPMMSLSPGDPVPAMTSTLTPPEQMAVPTPAGEAPLVRGVSFAPPLEGGSQGARLLRAVTSQSLQRTVTDQTGIPRSTLSKLCCGTAMPSLPHAAALETAFDIPMRSWLETPATARTARETP